jgi:hypothetical protein
MGWGQETFISNWILTQVLKSFPVIPRMLSVYPTDTFLQDERLSQDPARDESFMPSPHKMILPKI